MKELLFGKIWSTEIQVPSDYTDSFIRQVSVLPLELVNVSEGKEESCAF